MTITLEDVGKKYNRQWIFRHVDLQINNGDVLAITGHNGSGKSTLIQIISNYLTPSEGSVTYGSKDVADLQTTFSYVSPYQNLLDEFTLLEHLQFHAKFKKALCPEQEIIDQSGLTGNAQKLVKDFSSGMKQRLRLALGFFYESSVIFLDEPTSNLDQKGIDWYQNLMQLKPAGQTVIIASNQRAEYEKATQMLSIEKYKS